jgi:muramoyltetrapeptide carboxypeptidase
VAVPATAGLVPPERLRAGVARLESWGLRVRVGAHALDQDPDLPYLAGVEEARAGDLAAAWLDPEVAGVVVARGGYGTQRTVDLLDWRRMAEAAPKVLVGFSDVTALHQAMATHLGLVTVHGHVVTSLGAAEPDSAEGLRRLLMEPEQILELLTGSDPEGVVGGRATGVLVGGNLAMLASDLGTPSSRPALGGIVVVEDVDEPPYRIDRQLTHLIRAGWFAGVRGIVLGSFTGCGDPDQVAAVLRRRLVPLGVPMVANVDIGHTATSLSLPLGVRATLDADEGRLSLEQAALV